jgi:hypothetical protein
MWKTLCGLPTVLFCLPILLVVAGCSEGEGEMAAGAMPGGPGPGGPGGGPPGVRQIMGKLGRGPNSLTDVIGKELQQEPPPWETIQEHAKDYSQSAGELGEFDPPKGGKESWTKLTAMFAETAAELEKAAVAKDKQAAAVAHDQLKNSCNDCHQEHRRMGRGGGPGGFGPPGGPGGPGGGPGGPPRNGPGGRPPGGPGGP